MYALSRGSPSEVYFEQIIFECHRDLKTRSSLCVDVSICQIIQYINLVKSDSEPGQYGDYFTTYSGGRFPWLDATDFEQDEAAGHGTHTAGSAAGATLNASAETVTCSGSNDLGCVGGCINPVSPTDDLLSSSSQLFHVDLDRLCPSFDCGGYGEEVCLGDNVDKTLTEHGGIAQGAKLAIFDIFYDDLGLGSYAGNGVWEACLEAGCKIHSNSYGGDNVCEIGAADVEYDDFMYNVSTLTRVSSPLA